MKDKIFCRYERKEVNVRYYECPNRFENCEDCPKLRPSRKHLSIAKRKQKHVNRDKELSRDLFSDWNRYSAYWEWRLDPGTNEWVRDLAFLVEDSRILDHLIANYKIGASENEARGMKEFWLRVESLLNWKQGDWECLRQEEKTILTEARDGSIEAIQKLVIANPNMIRIPFVAKALADILRTIKFRDGDERKEAKKLWNAFLPRRESHKHVIKDEHLRNALTQIMKFRQCTKKNAVEFLLRAEPWLKEERLRKVWVGVKKRREILLK